MSHVTAFDYSKGKPDSLARSCKLTCRFVPSVACCLRTFISALVRYRAIQNFGRKRRVSPERGVRVVAMRSYQCRDLHEAKNSK